MQGYRALAALASPLFSAGVRAQRAGRKDTFWHLLLLLALFMAFLPVVCGPLRQTNGWTGLG
jgi:hypothetical protein